MTRDQKFRANVKFCMETIYASCADDMVVLSFRHYDNWRLIYRCLRVLISCNIVERERVGVKYKYRWVAHAPTTGSINWMVDTLRHIKKIDNDEYREIKLAKEA